MKIEHFVDAQALWISQDIHVKFVRNLRQKYPVKIIEENLQKI